MSNRSNAAKRWCFTINNWESEQSKDDWKQRFASLHGDGHVTYLVAGWEVGSSGTPHIQGYVALAVKQRISWLKGHISERAHYEVSRGTHAEAAEYCKKEQSYSEWGEFEAVGAGQGRRTDLEAIKVRIIAGDKMSAIAEDHFSDWVRYHKSFEVFQSYQSPKRNWVTEVFVYYGSTGTGKTRRVHEEEKDLWIAPDNSLKWFDGYYGQEAVLFDDFVSVRNDRFGFLLQLLDRYSMNVPVKGSFVNWCPKRIYFTSNLHPEQWFTGVTPQQFAALLRRFTRVTRFHGASVSEEGRFTAFA